MKALFRNMLTDQEIEVFADYDRAECSYGQGVWVDRASNEVVGSIGWIPLGYKPIWIKYEDEEIADSSLMVLGGLDR